MRFGDALESFFTMWKEERIKNQHTISWKEYLEENFCLKERNTRKKREVAIATMTRLVACETHSLY